MNYNGLTEVLLPASPVTVFSDDAWFADFVIGATSVVLMVCVGAILIRGVVSGTRGGNGRSPIVLRNPLCEKAMFCPTENREDGMIYMNMP